MKEPVNLQNLREMIDGDKELEKSLLDEFILSSEKLLAVIEKECRDGASNIWKEATHALKGIALNLGADKLAELCKAAQEGFQLGVHEKQKILEGIKNEYKLVKDFLKTC